MSLEFGPAQPRKRRGQNVPEGRTFKPGGIDRSIYMNAEWAIDLYYLLKEDIATMPDIRSEGAETSTLDQRVMSREFRSFAKVLVERIDQAAIGRGGLEEAIDRGQIVQVPITSKEQVFLIEIAEHFDLGEDAVQELRTLPAKGWY